MRIGSAVVQKRMFFAGFVCSLLIAGLVVVPGATSAHAESTTLVINEVDYDQPSTDTAEFLEIKNVSDATIDLGAYTVELVNGVNGGASVYGTIALPDESLAAGDYFVVCANEATVPNCDLDVAPDTNLIQNGPPDAVAIRMGETLVDAVSYEGDTGAPYTEGSGTGLEDGASAGESISRCADGVDTDQNNVDLVTAPSTPGATNDCPEPPPPPPPFGMCGDAATAIHDVQGAGATSPLAGTVVVVEGVLVGDFQNNAEADDGDLNGFYVQEENSEADSSDDTSEGVFVFAAGASDVAAGDVVRIRADVIEFTSSGGSSMTELTNIMDLEVCGTAPLPAPAPAAFPLGARSDLERFEGMRTVFPQDLVISEYFNYDRFGEMVLALPFDGQERLHTPTAVVEPGAAAIALQEEILLRRITLDDGLTVQNPAFTRHPNGAEFTLDNRFRGGDTVADVIGMIDESFGLYRIQPTAGADYTATNPRPDEPDDVGSDLTVSSFNVLNYFLTLDLGPDICGPGQNQECRGADTAEELERQRAKMLAALSAIEADVFGLIELENTTGVEPLADIVDGLNDAAGAGTYDYIDTGTIGTDAIKVGIIYKPATVSPLGEYAILDSSVDPRFLDDKNRPVLVQTFVDSAGGVFTIAVNHLKSKGSACDDVGDPDVGDGQGNCNQTRTQAAEAMVDWLATDPTGSGDADVLIMGDLNAYDKEDPIDAILEGPDDTLGNGDDYTDLIRRFAGEFAYSFVFDGLVGYLDHALSTGTMMRQVTGATEWHINADEPDLLDYDTSFKSPEQAALFAPDAYRSSDHDPVIVGLDLNVGPSCDTAAATPDQLFPPNHRFVRIGISGVTDPEGDAVTITVDSIFQDEAVDAPDSGNTAPDGRGVGSEVAQVRAERVGTGNGRVYHIGFTATDELGGSCSGVVQVGVPISEVDTAVDDGPLFDSTVTP
jgi:predicted extracellular nuclease